MTHKHSPKAVILVVSKTKTSAGDYIIDIQKVELEHVLPYRVAKRYWQGQKLGLEYVRSLGEAAALTIDPAGVQAVTVTDGKHALASWRRMNGISGFTGTHDVHPLVNMSGVK